MAIISQLRNNKILLKGGLFSLFSFFNQGVGFLLLIILAKYIVPAEYGTLSLFNTIVTFLGFLVSLSTNGYVSVSFFRKSRDEFRQSLSIVFLITFAVASFFALVLLVGNSALARMTELRLAFLWSALAIALMNCYFQIVLDYFRIREKLIFYGLLSCSFAIVNFAISLLLVVAMKLGWEGRIYAQVTCAVLYGLIAIYVCCRYRLFLFKGISWFKIRPILMWGVPLIPHLATSWIKQGGDRYIINYYYTFAEVGIFSFALNLSNIIDMIGSAFNQTNSVSIYQVLSSNLDDKWERLQRQIKAIFIVYTIGVVAVLAVCSILIPLVLPRYAASLPYFYLLALSGYFQCIYFLYTNYLFYYDKTKDLMMITFFSSLLHLMLSMWLTQYSLYYTCLIYVFLKFIMVALVVYWANLLLNKYVKT